MASSVLTPVQERGRAALERLGLPTRRQEAWRLTNLKRLAAVAELPASAQPTARTLPAVLAGVMRVVLDGSASPLQDQAWPEGVSLLTSAARFHRWSWCFPVVRGLWPHVCCCCWRRRRNST